MSYESSTLTVLGFASHSGNQIFVPMLLKSFLDRYHFQKFPDKVANGSNSYQFEHGLFEGRAIEAFDVYSDGFLVASKSDTSFIDGFVDDVLEFLDVDWGITLSKSNTVDRMYQSAFVFESKKNILKPLQAATKLADSLNERLAKTSGLDVEFNSFGISLSADQAKISSMKPSIFRIERRAGVEFDFGQYFTTAPLKTNDHLAMLEEWEKSL